MPLHEFTICESAHIDGEASCRCATQPTSRLGHPGTQRAEDVSPPCQVESGRTPPATRRRDWGRDDFSRMTPPTDVGGSLISGLAENGLSARPGGIFRISRYALASGFWSKTVG